MSLQDRLEQAKRDRRTNMDIMDIEIKAIEQQIADAEVTYSVGDRFKGHSKKWIISVCPRGNEVSLVALDSGCLCCSSTEVVDRKRITRGEFSVFAGKDLTRYWDARKQCKC